MANLLDLQTNQEQFDSERIMIVLRDYLQEENQELYQSITKIIYDLSCLPSNCLTLYDVGIAPVRN